MYLQRCATVIAETPTKLVMPETGSNSFNSPFHINTNFISDQGSELGRVAPYSRDPPVGDRLGLCGALHRHRFSLHRVLQEGF